MDSPPESSSIRSRLRAVFAEAGRSAFIIHDPTNRPWLRLLGLVALSGVIIVGLIAALGAVIALLATASSSLISADLLSEAIPDTPDRLYRESAFLIVLATTLGALALSILAAAAIVYGRPTAAFQWPGRKPSLSLLASGFVIMALGSLALWPISWLIEGGIDPAPILNPQYLLGSRLTYGATAALMLLIAAAAEEIVFRGVLLRILGGLTQRAWLLVLINGVLFSLIHLDPDPAAFVARAVSGMVWTWAALRLGGIEFAIGAHWANNLLIALLAEPMSEAAAVGQKIPAVYLFPELVIAVVMVVAVEWIVRRRRAAETA